jgi:hypothetical protein
LKREKSGTREAAFPPESVHGCISTIGGEMMVVMHKHALGDHNRSIGCRVVPRELILSDTIVGNGPGCRVLTHGLRLHPATHRDMYGPGRDERSRAFFRRRRKN